MVIDALKIVGRAFHSCVSWFDSILDSIQGHEVVISAILLVFITSLFLKPIRGGSIPVSSGISDFVGTTISSSPKYSSGKWIVGRFGYRGKYSKGNTVGKITRQRNLRK